MKRKPRIYLWCQNLKHKPDKVPSKFLPKCRQQDCIILFYFYRNKHDNVCLELHVKWMNIIICKLYPKKAVQNIHVYVYIYVGIYVYSMPSQKLNA